MKKSKNLKILLVGETIIDQYIFGGGTRKSGKEPHLVMQQETKKQYLGGAAAIANHLQHFVTKWSFQL